MVHNNHFCVIWRTLSSFPDAIRELEQNSKYRDNWLTDDFLRKVNENKFTISNEEKCMYGVFAFDLGTYNIENQQFCESFVAVYIILIVHMNVSMVI